MPIKATIRTYQKRKKSNGFKLTIYYLDYFGQINK
uniref:Uncharacterized protein n=1 Tax=Arundo donax TaxID=35708 RepID=A0A0A9I1U8_ARUDO